MAYKEILKNIVTPAAGAVDIYHNNEIHDATSVFLWESPEFEFREKKTDWYWTVGILGVGLAALAAITLQDYLFAGFALLATFVIILISRRKPSTLRIELSETGVRIESEIIPFQNIDAFWIDTEFGKHRIDLRLPVIILGIVAILMAIFIMKNYYFAGYFLVATILGTMALHRAEEGGAHPHLLLYSEQVSIPLGSFHLPTYISLVDLRDFLIEILPEVEMHESYLKQIADRLRF